MAKAGRPPSLGPSTEIRVKLPNDLKTHLDAAAGSGELSAWVRQAIEEKLDRTAESEARELTADYREKMRQHRVRLAIDGGPFITDR